MERKIIVTIPEKDYEKTIWAIEKIVGSESIILPRSENTSGIADNAKTLPENFTAEDLLNPEYRTDIHRILGRLLLKYGTKENGILKFPLISKKKETLSMDHENIFLATKLEDCDREYREFLDGEIFCKHEYAYIHDSKERSYDQNLINEYPEVNYEIYFLLKRYLTDDTSLREPNPFDHIDFGDMLYTTKELNQTGELDNRAYNILRAAKINTIGYLLTFSRSELRKIRNLGWKSLHIIEEALTKRGYALKPF